MSIFSLLIKSRSNDKKMKITIILMKWNENDERHIYIYTYMVRHFWVRVSSEMREISLWWWETYMIVVTCCWWRRAFRSIWNLNTNKLLYFSPFNFYRRVPILIQPKQIYKVSKMYATKFPCRINIYFYVGQKNNKHFKIFAILHFLWAL